MKKLGIYIVIMVLIIVIVPLVIVKSCSHKEAAAEPQEGHTVIQNDIKIKVYLHEKQQVVEMMLEEYLKGVVAAEMPAEFEPEALKAQAVAARTYAYSNINKAKSLENDIYKGADVSTDSAHCQAWISKEEALGKWDSASAGKYWSKIESAVEQTKGIIMTYNDAPVDQAVFHSNSGGKTENSEDVWGNEYPYLKSVQSFGEEESSEYTTTTVIKCKDFCQKLKAEYPNIKINEKDPSKDIKVMSSSDGNRVKTIKIGNTTLNGTDVRKLFELKSTNFKVEKEGADALKITTIGNGHGVGMSQWGANYLAKSNAGYEEILKYYYKDIGLSTIDTLALN